MNRVKEIKDIIKNYPQYEEMLFIRGYLVTENKINDIEGFPFYGNWDETHFGTLKNERPIYIYYHKMQDFYSYLEDNITISIIGHAYNPFDMIYEEEILLKDLVAEYKKGKENFFDKVNELTGIHLILLNDNGKILAVQDCSGMKSCYFGKVDSYIYISSHPQLIGDICSLRVDPFVTKLVNSRPYNIGNRHLPGNITPYKELKRLGGNTYVRFVDKFEIKRFYPIKPHNEIQNKDEFDEGIKKISDIIHRNLELASEKWNRPAISLSGGTDSKTTLSCANGIYDKFKYFSFHCKPQELVDATAAHEICDKLEISHDIYSIPDNNEDVENFSIIKKIINHNTSYFMNLSDHEIRKMIYLYHLNDFDIELKSWASETARVFLERKYSVKMPLKLTERHLSIFQTRYFLTPSLLRKSDQIYADFMKETGLLESIFNYEHTDLFYWEVRLGAWGTSVVSAFDICHNVTMPINNRKLMELFLAFPHEDRKSDKVHKEVIKLSDNRIEDMNIDIKNLYFHPYRIWLEKIFYYYKTLFYRSKI